MLCLVGSPQKKQHDRGLLLQLEITATNFFEGMVSITLLKRWRFPNILLAFFHGQAKPGDCFTRSMQHFYLVESGCLKSFLRAQL